MANSYFKFKQFTIHQTHAAMKVGTDGVLLGAWAEITNVNQILDIGTGTGVIALMLAQRNTTALIDAVEIDSPSAKQAELNAEKSPWEKRISVINKSFQNFVEENGNKYDLIVSNPPYFDQSLKSPFEHRTLTRHNDTLPYDELLSGISKLLTAGGKFCGVFPYTEGNVFIAKASVYGLFCNKKLNIQSKPNRNTLRILIQLEFEKKPIEESTLCIHDLEGNYTDDYKQLTVDFYLAF
ncbi:MAG: tRNA1(Val) (adenine(37)-N6)-methyltransferase [Bacteroidales bacterium]